MVAAFLEPEKYQNSVIAIYDEVLTCEQMVKTFTEVTGIKARGYPSSRTSLAICKNDSPHQLLVLSMSKAWAVPRACVSCGPMNMSFTYDLPIIVCGQRLFVDPSARK